MGARAGSGNKAGASRAKNAAMAAYMKAKGIDRNTARCPICSKVVHINPRRDGLYSHLAFHPAPATVAVMPQPRQVQVKETDIKKVA